MQEPKQENLKKYRELIDFISSIVAHTGLDGLRDIYPLKQKVVFGWSISIDSCGEFHGSSLFSKSGAIGRVTKTHKFELGLSHKSEVTNTSALNEGLPDRSRRKKAQAIDQALRDRGINYNLFIPLAETLSHSAALRYTQSML
jgi:hypothetical protein